jgi:hypothetical protein
MPRKKIKNSVACSFRIREDLSDRLDAYSELSRIPKTALVEFALKDFLDRVAPTDPLVPDFHSVTGLPTRKDLQETAL